MKPIKCPICKAMVGDCKFISERSITQWHQNDKEYGGIKVHSMEWVRLKPMERIQLISKYFDKHGKSH